MTDGISMNERDRLLRRIESTAIGLGARLGEFQSFVQTPAGQAMMANAPNRTLLRVFMGIKNATELFVHYIIKSIYQK